MQHEIRTCQPLRDVFRTFPEFNYCKSLHAIIWQKWQWISDKIAGMIVIIISKKAGRLVIEIPDLMMIIHATSWRRSDLQVEGSWQRRALTSATRPKEYTKRWASENSETQLPRLPLTTELPELPLSNSFARNIKLEIQHSKSRF